LATFSKLNSGSWRAQAPRKGKYVNETFLRREDAEESALDVERRIDRGEPAIARGSRDAKTFGDLIKLHREDLQQLGKRIGRSRSALAQTSVPANARFASIRSQKNIHTP
jgi:hypothetical protein